MAVQHEHGHHRLARPAAVTRARWLNVLTIAWNGTEGVIALIAGVIAGSVSLVGFGIDSAVEVSAALALAWRLHQERRDDCTQPSDRVATRLIAIAFGALTVYVVIEAVRQLAVGHEPDVSVVGVVVASMSLLAMPVLARAKHALAPALGSTAVIADARQTQLCAWLSGVVLIGLVANWAVGWWWADPLAALAIGAVAGREAVRTWGAESLEDTCCA